MNLTLNFSVLQLCRDVIVEVGFLFDSKVTVSTCFYIIPFLEWLEELLLFLP